MQNFLCTVIVNTASVADFFFLGVKGNFGLCLCYIILLLITHYFPQQTGNSDEFEDEEATTMCSHGQIPGEQHFHKVLSWLPHAGPRPTY